MDERELPSDVRGLVALWRSYQEMADDLGGAPDYQAHMPRDWARRGRIPAEHIDPIVNAARKRGFQFVTHEFVAKLVRAEASAA